MHIGQPCLHPRRFAKTPTHRRAGDQLPSVAERHSYVDSRVAGNVPGFAKKNAFSRCMQRVVGSRSAQPADGHTQPLL